MTVTIWSSAENRDVEVEFTPERHAALTGFVKRLADSGEWFEPSAIACLMPSPHNEDDMFDTTAIVQAFLPAGFAVEQHGWEDFVVVPAE